jgi:hypothetical protein
LFPVGVEPAHTLHGIHRVSWRLPAPPQMSEAEWFEFEHRECREKRMAKEATE